MLGINLFGFLHDFVEFLHLATREGPACKEDEILDVLFFGLLFLGEFRVELPAEAFGVDVIFDHGEHGRPDEPVVFAPFVVVHEDLHHGGVDKLLGGLDFYPCVTPLGVGVVGAAGGAFIGIAAGHWGPAEAAAGRRRAEAAAWGRSAEAAARRRRAGAFSTHTGPLAPHAAAREFTTNAPGIRHTAAETTRIRHAAPETAGIRHTTTHRHAAAHRQTAPRAGAPHLILGHFREKVQLVDVDLD